VEDEHMEIRKRVGHPRGFFHVMNRGARKVSIFADVTDRIIFRGLLGRFAEKHAVKVLGWCLMPNHYHLESDCEGTPLSMMMRDLDRTYARSFNDRHGTSGCLFQGPFKSMLIQDLEGLAYVNRYIHLNPVDLGRSPESYEWSSCSVYLGLRPAPSWMDVDTVLRSISEPGRPEEESYAYYLEEGLRRKSRKKKRKRGDMAGEFYMEWIRHLEERCLEKTTGQEASLGKVTLQTLVAYLAHRVYDIPALVISDFYGYGSPASVRTICARLQEKINADSATKAFVESVALSTKLRTQK
jgi:hypothetical protein